MLISSLVDKTITKIQKIKVIDSGEWDVLDNIIKPINQDITNIIQQNQKIIDYYNSQDFNNIKATCETLMKSQKEFNEYIDEKVKSISKLFGTKIIRNETIIDDEYNYIRPYKKSITPFTAEVSQAVFSSAENSPLEYIVKHFYPNKDMYPQQIQKLQTLIEELETLKDAKQIIENYKQEYQQYITNVPDYIMQYDKDGFYERLGFANISENTLTVEYKFVYTSNGGRTQKSFTVPMTEEVIIQLIDTLQNKLTQSSFSKEQRKLMTSKLRQKIKERDNYTCKICGNSTHKEPNLLLEIDHIVPVAKGGYTEEDNLQTLCWKCNRHKSDNLL
jgi:rubrerythrin